MFLVRCCDSACFDLIFLATCRAIGVRTNEKNTRTRKQKAKNRELNVAHFTTSWLAELWHLALRKKMRQSECFLLPLLSWMRDWPMSNFHWHVWSLVSWFPEHRLLIRINCFDFRGWENQLSFLIFQGQKSNKKNILFKTKNQLENQKKHQKKIKRNNQKKSKETPKKTACFPNFLRSFNKFL